MGLLKQQRLRTAHDFKAVLDAGSHAADRQFRVAVLRDATAPADSGRSAYQLGISVGKKSGGAVQRNRIKRQLRELLRTILAEMQLSGQVVVVVRPAAASLTYGEMEQSLRRIFRRIPI